MAQVVILGEVFVREMRTKTQSKDLPTPIRAAEGIFNILWWSENDSRERQEFLG